MNNVNRAEIGKAVGRPPSGGARNTREGTLLQPPTQKRRVEEESSERGKRGNMYGGANQLKKENWEGQRGNIPGSRFASKSSLVKKFRFDLQGAKIGYHQLNGERGGGRKE